MRNRKLFIVIVGCCLFINLFISPQTSNAHRLMIKQENDGVIHVYYDDGTPGALSVVTAYDSRGNKLFEKTVNEDGSLIYDTELNIHRFVADDGLGHRASTLHSESDHSNEIPVFIRAMAGIAILLFIAALFFYRVKRAENKKQ
ncbi:hypothetical protein [Gracilibacillus lacisalsi]|uniref:hypothetical protein n=1 Tax=Gracilibacillus lacisalsi TaxID=393087 RepID=UPI00036C1C80|nr:hypothetical protein [Gracilibacillus lacisalsi]